MPSYSNYALSSKMWDTVDIICNFSRSHWHAIKIITSNHKQFTWVNLESPYANISCTNPIAIASWLVAKILCDVRNMVG